MALKSEITFRRTWAMPNKWTFSIKPIAELLDRYVGDGKGWVDPFAGKLSPAEMTNDMSEDSIATWHLDAFDFVDCLDGQVFNGCLFDPPYSMEQIARSYKSVGKSSKLAYTKDAFCDPTGSFKKVKDEIGRRVIPGGLVICFGWNSNGFGKGRGFVMIDGLVVAHGGHHNDTIVTVEMKVRV